MLFKTIVAAFFLEKVSSLADAARAAAMVEPRPLDDVDRRALGFHEPGREVLAGRWGAFGDTWSTLDDVDGIKCLQLYSSQNSFLNAQPSASEPGADEWMLPYVETFRDACIALNPVAALLDTRSHFGDERWENRQGNRDWVLAQARLVAASRTDALADERYSLLYVGPRLVQLWTPDPVRNDRDFVEVPSGRLAFARSGPYRMA